MDAPTIPGPDHAYVTPTGGLEVAVDDNTVVAQVTVPDGEDKVTVGELMSGIIVYVNEVVQPVTGCVAINTYVVAVVTATVVLFTPLANPPPDEVHVYVLPAGVAVPETTTLVAPHTKLAV